MDQTHRQDWMDVAASRSSPRELQQDKPHSARMYDFYLGGKTNYEVDRQTAGHAIKAFPGALTFARTNREFMHRATRYLASDVGIRQFLDIGTGIPTSPNLHEVAQAAVPHARVVYVDNDPIVLAHARALLNSAPEGQTVYVQADIRDPASILRDRDLTGTLDLDKPVALSLNAIFHFVSDTYDPHGIVQQIMAALPSGSYLVLSHCTADFAGNSIEGAVEEYKRQGVDAQLRSCQEVEAFFQGLELVEPGVVVAHHWRAENVGLPGNMTDAEVSLYAGVARKP